MSKKFVRGQNFNDRKHMLVLYPEDPTHCEALETIKKSFDYAYILHDRDLEEDGSIKKPHWHIVLRFPNARWSHPVCKEIGIEPIYIEPCRNLERGLQYLIHYNDTDKAQYKLNEVKGPLYTKLKESINKIEKSEGEKVCELIEFIEGYDGYLSVKDFAHYCALNGYWAEFRRSGTIFCKIIEEHNQRYVMTNKHSSND